MPTINISSKIKEIFKKKKLTYSVKMGKNISEDKFEEVLLNSFDKKFSIGKNNNELKGGEK